MISEWLQIALIDSTPAGSADIETQANLNFAKDNRPKRVRVTSLEAWREVQASLPHREKIVTECLGDYLAPNSHDFPPTAYELFEFMRDGYILDQPFDINCIRPRVHALVEKEILAYGEKVKCSVTGKNAFVIQFADQVQAVIK